MIETKEQLLCKTFGQLISILRQFEGLTTVVTDQEDTYYLEFEAEKEAISSRFFAALQMHRQYVRLYVAEDNLDEILRSGGFNKLSSSHSQ